MSTAPPASPAPAGVVYVLTDRHALPPGRPLAATVQAAVDGGAAAVVLRERDLPRHERASLADQLQELCASAGARLLFASCDPRGNRITPAQGLHLRVDEPLPTVRPALLGRSTHTAAEIVLATAQGCDYLTISPVALTPSKPGYGPPLGASGLHRILSTAQTATRHPIRNALALGGVTSRNAGSFISAGAHGVAVMGEVMRAEHPDHVVADLLAAVHP